jgi:capsular exopolysaccharide synthesis family protein
MNDLSVNKRIGAVSGIDGNSTSEEVIDLGALVAVVWRGKWRIFLIATLAVLMGGYYAFVVAVPVFRSTAVVMLDTRQEQVLDFQSVAGSLKGDDSELNSEVEVLRSRRLMGGVVDQLNLVEDPEFNGALQEPSAISQGISAAKDAVKSALGASSEEIELSPEEEAVRTRESVVSALLEKVSVLNVPMSYVFQITAETEDARKSALIADTVAALYIRSQLEDKFEATEQTTNWLTGRVADLRVELEQAEAEVAKFNASTDLVSIEALNSQEVQLKDLRERVTTLEASVAAGQVEIETLQAAETYEAKAAAASNPQLDRLLGDVSDGDAAAIARFDAQFGLLVSRSIVDQQRKQQQLEALVASEQEMQAQIASRGDDLIKLQQLTREAEAVRLLYEYFLTRLKETSAQQGIHQADSRVLSAAVIPERAASPNKPRTLAVAGVFGLLVGAALVFLREMRNNSFRSARELEEATNKTVLGQIPQLPMRDCQAVLKNLRDKPSSAAAEAIRNLRTSILLSNVDQPPQVILCTSSVPGEGKTTNSLALAQQFAGLNQSVLLIEADIRRRTISEYLPGLTGSAKGGLVSAVTREQSLEKAVNSDLIEGVDLLLGEITATNAADLFSSRHFANFMAEARAKYDYIILDTPPVLVVPDARILAQHADSVVFMVEWNATTRQQVAESMRQLEVAQSKISGFVLNQINVKQLRNMGYGDSYGPLSQYGSKYYQR